MSPQGWVAMNWFSPVQTKKKTSVMMKCLQNLMRFLMISPPVRKEGNNYCKICKIKNNKNHLPVLKPMHLSLIKYPSNNQVLQQISSKTSLNWSIIELQIKAMPFNQLDNLRNLFNNRCNHTCQLHSLWFNNQCQVTQLYSRIQI